MPDDHGAHPSLNPFELEQRPSDDALESMFTLLAAQDDQAGWDRPSMLYGVTPAGRSEQDPLADRYELVSIRPLPGHPLDELTGTYLDEGFCTAVLSAEGWAYPKDASDTDLLAPPSQCPGRREVRLYAAVRRTGTTLSRAYVRTPTGSVRVDESGLRIDDFVVDALGRCLGVDTYPRVNALPLTSYLGCLTALRCAVAWQEYETVSSQAAASVMIVAATAVAAQLARECFSTGYSGFPPYASRVLDALADGRTEDALQADSLGFDLATSELHSAVGAVTWTSVIADGASCTQWAHWPSALPCDLGAALWLGEPLLERWAFESSPFALGEVHRAVDALPVDAQLALVGVLARLGWGVPAMVPPLTGRTGDVD